VFRCWHNLSTDCYEIKPQKPAIVITPRATIPVRIYGEFALLYQSAGYKKNWVEPDGLTLETQEETRVKAEKSKLSN